MVNKIQSYEPSPAKSEGANSKIKKKGKKIISSSINSKKMLYELSGSKNVFEFLTRREAMHKGKNMDEKFDLDIEKLKLRKQFNEKIDLDTERIKLQRQLSKTMLDFQTRMIDTNLNRNTHKKNRIKLISICHTGKISFRKNNIFKKMKNNRNKIEYIHTSTGTRYYLGFEGGGKSQDSPLPHDTPGER